MSHSNTMNGVVRTVGASMLAFVLAACGGRAPSLPSIDQAQTAVNRANASQSVRDHAPVLLVEAQEKLGEAKTMWARGDDQPAVDATAYVAQRKAESALEKGRAGAALARAEALEDERAELLISAREREAEQALSQAERERRRAELARDEAQMARSEAEAARAEAQAAKQALAAARDELADLKPRITERGLVLTLPDVLFEVDSAELKPASLSTLDKLAEYLVQYPDYALAVEGHTDSTGTDSYNQGLSERRAQSAQTALVQRGVSASRIQLAGYGESQPVADNSTAGGRALNRRVEVILLK